MWFETWKRFNNLWGWNSLCNYCSKFQQGEFFGDKILGDNFMFKDFEEECNKNAKLEKKKLEFPNGAIYEGQVLDGKRHGKGIYTWKDGTKYEGSFEND